MVSKFSMLAQSFTEFYLIRERLIDKYSYISIDAYQQINHKDHKTPDLIWDYTLAKLLMKSNRTELLITAI